MTVSDFEDPRDLLRCIQSDCTRAQAGGSPFCAQHLREQETKSPGIVEPELEARLAKVRTEDDDHPGMVKVYDKETGEASWVPAEPAPLYVGPDPDVNGIDYDKDRVAKALRLDVPTWNQRAGIDPMPGIDLAGVWVAATTTRIMVFDNELEALRYAVANQARAEFVPFGQELQLPG